MAKEDEKLPITVYSILSAMPVVLALVFLVGTIVIQSTFEYTEEAGYTFPQTLGIIFSSSAIPMVTLSNSYDASQISAVSAVIAMIVGILMILLATYMARGYKWAMWSSLGLAAADTICMIVLFVLSASGEYAISLRVQDYVLQIMMHVLLLGVLIAAIILKFKMDKANKPKVHE